MRRHRLAATIASGLAAGLVLSGCAGGTGGGAGPTTASAGGTADRSAASEGQPSGSVPATDGASGSAAPGPVVAVDGAAWEHVHNLALDGTRLVVGTHGGVWTQDPGQDPVQASEMAFDVMGLALAGDRWLASGHPAEGQDAPDDLGLQESTDAGRTWSPVSLAGEVDFHRLAAAGDTVMGMSAHDGRLLRSTDGGTTWTDLGTPPLFDLAVDPRQARTVVATTEEGPVRSTDGGATFGPVKGAPLIAFLAWSGDTLYGLAPDGTVHASTDSGATWTARGSAGAGSPGAFAADGDTLVALAGATVVQSTDGGATFDPRLSIDGAQGH